MGLINKARRKATVICSSDCVLATMNINHFKNILSKIILILLENYEQGKLDKEL